MKLKNFVAGIGDTIGTDYGNGEIIAITDQWCIIKGSDGEEISINKSNKVSLWLPVQIKGWKE